MINATDLTHTFGTGTARTTALDAVSVDLTAGSTAIMGPSGSGKTTLLHCLAGIITPTSGVVRLGDTVISSLSDRERTALRRSQFGFVFQSGQLLPELPAVENVALPLMLGGLSLRQARGRAGEWLARLGLAGMEGRRPGELSGGQAQRVAIARALVANPAVIFADEPTGALDQQTGADVMNALTTVTSQAGAALVVVTHDAEVARRCSRTIAMRDGRIVGDFTAPPAHPAPTTGAAAA